MSERPLTIVLGVTGSIAAYKAAFVASRLHQLGHDVHVVMTTSATRLVTPATFFPLTANAVQVDLWDAQAVRGGARVEHVGLADRADVFAIVPATANTIGKLANGIADNFLTTLFLAYPGPVVVAPAMNDNMYAHPAVQKNLETLRGFGYRFVDPETGALACGREGVGRLADPEAIVDAIVATGRGGRAGAAPRTETAVASGSSDGPSPRKRLRVLVTAGPTREALDPVRHLTNRSTGRMGDAIAAALRDRGHEVTLVRGPIDRPAPAGVRAVSVTTTAEMRDACEAAFDAADACVMAAAPCDFRPVQSAATKLKKQDLGASPSVALERTPDILAGLGARKAPHQRLVGFALETGDGRAEALRKLAAKNLDRIVLNHPGNFGDPAEARATLLDAAGAEQPLAGTKADVACQLACAVEGLFET